MKQTVRVNRATDMIEEMKEHRCECKVFTPSDSVWIDKKETVLGVGYKCLCGFNVTISLDDLKKEKVQLAAFWKCVKTPKGRKNFAASFFG